MHNVAYFATCVANCATFTPMKTLLSDILFKDCRRRVLGLLLLHPDQRYHVREIARLTFTVAGTVNKELRKLAEAGLLLKEKQGNQLYYQANSNCIVFEELASLLRKTSGLAEVLAEALLPQAETIKAAFVFGSIASGKAGNDSDIDLCVIGDVDYTELVKLLYPCQSVLRREINPKCFSREEWLQQKDSESAFIRELMEKPVINIIGDRDDLR